ncbi:MAG TPA: hypothetical protein VHV77_04190 [Pirellulales bacterium]|jgi:hypothetical protein|nr:hypothetical protein [Pirellulales bacterium]
MSTATLTAPPRLRPTTFDDFNEIARLEVSNGLIVQDRSDWQNLWTNSPLWPRLGNDWPIGWVLEDPTGRVVGSLINVPSAYRFRGEELICANGRAWNVAPDYRGFALFLFEEYFDRPRADLFINTTVNAIAEPAIRTLSDRVPIGDFQTVSYWVTGYRGFARKALRKLRVPGADLLAWPAGAALGLKDIVCCKSFPSAPRSVAVEAIEGFDSRFDAFWNELVEQNPDKLLGVRDAQTLAWHFAAPLRHDRLWIFTASRHNLLRAYCIVKWEEHRGGLNRMRIVDYQTVDREVDLLPALLRPALDRCSSNGFHILEHLGRGLPKMRSLEDYVPYRMRLTSWLYYYRAAEKGLATELSRPEAWDPSLYDGDASFD